MTGSAIMPAKELLKLISVRGLHIPEINGSLPDDGMGSQSLSEQMEPSPASHRFGQYEESKHPPDELVAPGSPDFMHFDREHA